MIFTYTLTGLSIIAVFDPDEGRRARARRVLTLLWRAKVQRDESSIGSEEADEPPAEN